MRVRQAFEDYSVVNYLTEYVACHVLRRSMYMSKTPLLLAEIYNLAIE